MEKQEPKSPEAIEVGIKVSRRARMLFDPGDAVLHYCWRHWKKRPHSLDDAIAVISERGFKEPDVILSGMLGMATLEELAILGDGRAAQYLVDRCLGVPDKPFQEKIQNISIQEADAMIRQEMESLGYHPGIIDDFMGGAGDPTTDALEHPSATEGEGGL